MHLLAPPHTHSAGKALLQTIWPARLDAVYLPHVCCCGRRCGGGSRIAALGPRMSGVTGTRRRTRTRSATATGKRAGPPGGCQRHAASLGGRLSCKKGRARSPPQPLACSFGRLKEKHRNVLGALLGVWHSPRLLPHSTLGMPHRTAIFIAIFPQFSATFSAIFFGRPTAISHPGLSQCMPKKTIPKC